MFLLLLGLFSGPAHAHDDVAAARKHLFMPAIELGVLWHADPEIAPGVFFRTSLEYRFQRIQSGFVRLSYDATSPRLTQLDTDGAALLEANVALHDVYVGGGYRAGPPVFQVVPSAHVGVQIGEVPMLTEADDTLVVDTTTTVTGLGVVALGFEYYVDEDIAITAEISGRARFTPLLRGSLFGGAATLGITTAF
jgi:hypothetical protein